MAYEIDRTAMTDDDGTGTTGTVFNDAWKTALYDEIDDIFSAGGGWDSWSPTYTNFSLGDGTATAKYVLNGHLVLVDLFIVFGTTTAVSGAMHVTNLPVANTAINTAQVLGQLGMFDASAGFIYSGTVYTNGATDVVPYAHGSPNSAVNTTVPFTWAVNDQISLRLTYQKP